MKPFLVGLTGQTGAGKSTVSEYFLKEDIAVIDCDAVSREVTKKGSECTKEIKRNFKNVVNEEFELDRTALAKIVFNNKDELKKLNSIIFPYITRRINMLVKACIENSHSIIMLDAPTLFESGVYRVCDMIISVTSDEKLRKLRIMNRDKINAIQAMNRMSSQYSESFFRMRSDFIIENNGDKASLISAVERAAKLIKEKANEK